MKNNRQSVLSLRVTASRRRTVEQLTRALSAMRGKQLTMTDVLEDAIDHYAQHLKSAGVYLRPDRSTNGKS